MHAAQSGDEADLSNVTLIGHARYLAASSEQIKQVASIEAMTQPGPVAYKPFVFDLALSQFTIPDLAKVKASARPSSAGKGWFGSLF